MDDQLIQIRNMEVITKEQASIDEFGADYTGGDISTVIKYEMWIDADALSTLNTGATEIRGYQFDMDWDTGSAQTLDWVVTDGSKYIGTTAPSTEITWNADSGNVAVASATATVDINAANDGPPSFIGTESLIATFYINPSDQSADALTQITIKDMLVVTDVGNIEQADYTVLDIV